MNIQILQVPYDSGHESLRTGMGPIHFIQNGIDAHLRNRGHHVNVTAVASGIPFSTEIGTTFDVMRNLSQQVRSAADCHHFPVVLAGNCNTCVGTIAGLDSNHLGIVWFDAHGDFNTPETTTTGFLDGMGLAMATGRCWKSLLRTIPDFTPVPDDRIVHAGSRDLDPEERRMFQEAKIPLLVPDPEKEDEILAGLEQALGKLKNRVQGIYLHIDMDVLEEKHGKPNHLAVPGGLRSHLVCKAIGVIKTHLKIEACAIASYDPSLDEDRHFLEAGFKIIDAVVAAEHGPT